jgi:transcriptional regulator with XRE-family HTH domain
MKRRSVLAPPRPDDVVLDHLATNVEKLRHELQWSLATLAKQSGVGASQLKHIVNRRANPSVADVLRLANAFDVPVGNLTSAEIDRTSIATEAGSTPRYDPERFGAAFGGRLRSYRKRRGMAVRALAVLADIARNTLRAAESSDVGPGTRIAARIAHALGMSFAEFVESLHSSVLAIAPQRSGSGESERSLLHDTSAGDLLCMEELSLVRGQLVERAPCSPGSTTMVYTLEGGVRIGFAAERIELKSGEAALLASDRPYSVSAFGARAARLLMVVRSAEIEPHEDTP